MENIIEELKISHDKLVCRAHELELCKKQNLAAIKLAETETELDRLINGRKKIQKDEATLILATKGLEQIIENLETI